MHAERLHEIESFLSRRMREIELFLLKGIINENIDKYYVMTLMDHRIDPKVGVIKNCFSCKFYIYNK
jgi:hypothetical protein